MKPTTIIAIGFTIMLLGIVGIGYNVVTKVPFTPHKDTLNTRVYMHLLCADMGTPEEAQAHEKVLDTLMRKGIGESEAESNGLSTSDWVINLAKAKLRRRIKESLKDWYVNISEAEIEEGQMAFFFKRAIDRKLLPQGMDTCEELFTYREGDYK